MRFFVMNRSVVGSVAETNFSDMPPVNEGETPTCPGCGVYIGSIPMLPPYRMELKAHGKELGDVAFGPGDSLLVSARFRETWEGAGLRGLVFTPLERIRVRPARLGKKSPSYFHVAPQFFGTRIDMGRSRFEHEEPIKCQKCQDGDLIMSIRGMTIDEASWTGEDLFFAWGLCGNVIVTDRVRQLRDDHGLTNINLTPVEEFFWDPYNRWVPIDYSPPDWYKPDDTDDDAQSLAN